VTRRGADERKMLTNFWFESLKRRDHSEDRNIDGMILKWVLKK
jgi:hypothetical protein